MKRDVIDSRKRFNPWIFQIFRNKTTRDGTFLFLAGTLFGFDIAMRANGNKEGWGMFLIVFLGIIYGIIPKDDSHQREEEFLREYERQKQKDSNKVTLLTKEERQKLDPEERSDLIVERGRKLLLKKSQPEKNFIKSAPMSEQEKEEIEKLTDPEDVRDFFATRAFRNLRKNLPSKKKKQL
ncbi:hypothetical protein ACFL1E_07340 [Candidatus Omnitrophota bacterium]